MAEALLLLTKDDPQILAKQGFSGSWAANASRAIGCEHVVICDLKSGNGVLAATITGVMKADSGRIVVHFKDPVEINKPEVWGRKSSNPVGYVDAQDCKVDFKDIGL